MDNKIIQVALDGLENILKVGEEDKNAAGAGAINSYAAYVEECGGMVTIHNLQHHENLEIYKKCFFIMDKYFPDEEEAEETGVDAPQVNEAGQFSFANTMAAPAGGFSFGTPANGANGGGDGMTQ
jgi:importin subunit alpha-1